MGKDLGKEKSLADVIKLLEKEGRSLASSTESEMLLAGMAGMAGTASEVDIEPYIDDLVDRLGQDWIVRDAPLTVEEMFADLYERFQALKRGQQDLLEELRCLSESIQSDREADADQDDLDFPSQPMSPGPILEQ
jgi:hypothetical protein